MENFRFESKNLISKIFLKISIFRILSELSLKWANIDVQPDHK